MGRRPPHVKPPAHLSTNPPVPEPDETPPDPEEKSEDDDDAPRDRDPTRYGDWELKGIAVDF